MEGHNDWVQSVTYSLNGRRIISGSFDNTIRIWDSETGAAVGEPLKGHNDGPLRLYLPHPRASSTEPPLPVAYVVTGRRCIGALTVAAKAGL